MKFPNVAVHAPPLHYPGGALLEEDGPEDHQRGKQDQEGYHSLQLLLPRELGC